MTCMNVDDDEEVFIANEWDAKRVMIVLVKICVDFRWFISMGMQR